MLDRLERHHDIDAGVRQRQVTGVALDVAQVGTDECAGGRPYGVVVELHPDDGLRYLRQLGTAVALSAGHIEHVPIPAERPGEQVAVVMLDLDLAADCAGQPLPREGLRRLGGFPAE